MKRVPFVALAAVAVVLIADRVAGALGTQTAKTAAAAYVAPAPPAPKLPTKVTLAGAASAGTTLTSTGQCLRISCTVDCAYRVTVGSSTATVDDNQLPAGTPERLCMSTGQDTVTFYSATAGAAYVAATMP